MEYEVAEALAHQIVLPVTVEEFDEQLAAGGRSSVLDSVGEQSLGEQVPETVPG